MKSDYLSNLSVIKEDKSNEKNEQSANKAI